MIIEIILYLTFTIHLFSHGKSGPSRVSMALPVREHLGMWEKWV